MLKWLKSMWWRVVVTLLAGAIAGVATTAAFTIESSREFIDNFQVLIGAIVGLWGLAFATYLNHRLDFQRELRRDADRRIEIAARIHAEVFPVFLWIDQHQDGGLRDGLFELPDGFEQRVTRDIGALGAEITELAAVWLPLIRQFPDFDRQTDDRENIDEVVAGALRRGEALHHALMDVITSDGSIPRVNYVPLADSEPDHGTGT